ncbi:MAG: DUF1295 domain-containing protein [Chloroflexi bacterium]|nr:DUF1295 domain-containing protein [Chloroflexota bacterium]
MDRLVLFVLGSAGIFLYSRSSFRWPAPHGFFRFFAFEGILGQVLLAAVVWFKDVTSLPQIISWLLLAASVFLAVHGFYLLHSTGQPQGNFENTTILVQRGAYAYIRHPLYTSLLLLSWGIFFKDLSLVGFLLAAITSVFLFATAKTEEAENLAHFGPAYAAYMQKTARFIPYIF